MTKDRWLEVKEKITETFSDVLTGTDELEVGSMEWLEFTMPDNKRMRVEWHDKPKKLGEKTITSKRIGADVKIESEYSETDRSQYIILKSWNEASSDWVESQDAAAFM